MKKVFIISSVLLAVVLVFLGINKFVFERGLKPVPGGKNETTSSEEEVVVAEEATEEADGKISLFSPDNASATVLSLASQSLVYFSKTDRKIKQIFLNKTGSQEVALPENLSGIANVSISPRGDKAIIKTGEGGKISFYLFDLISQETAQIKNGVDNIFWDNTGEKIIYKYYEAKTGKRTLNISDPDGKNWKNLADIFFRNVSASPIPQSALVSYWNSPDAYEETSLWTVGAIGGDPKEILKGKFGADYLWSPGGKKALVSFVDSRGGGKMILGVMNYNGGEVRTLNFSTLTSKCVWGGEENIYCALPGSIPGNAVMPNEYLVGKIQTADTFWKINIASAKQERIIELKELQKENEEFDAENLIYSPEAGSIFFTNKKNGKIYKIEL